QFIDDLQRLGAAVAHAQVNEHFPQAHSPHADAPLGLLHPLVFLEEVGRVVDDVVQEPYAQTGGPPQIVPQNFPVGHEPGQVQVAQVANAPGGQKLFRAVVDYDAVRDEGVGGGLGQVINELLP